MKRRVCNSSPAFLLDQRLRLTTYLIVTILVTDMAANSQFSMAVHVLAMLAIGVSVAALGVRFRWAAAGVMSLALLVGGFSAGVMQATINIDPMLAATFLMLSLMIVHKRTFSAALCLGLLSVFTFFQGLAHGLEAPSQALLLPFMSGVVLASLGLLVLGMGLGRRAMLRFPRAQLGFGGLLGIVAMGFLFGA